MSGYSRLREVTLSAESFTTRAPPLKEHFRNHHSCAPLPSQCQANIVTDFLFNSRHTYSLNMMDECSAEITLVLFTLSLGPIFIWINSEPGRDHPVDSHKNIPTCGIHMFPQPRFIQPAKMFLIQRPDYSIIHWTCPFLRILDIQVQGNSTGIAFFINTSTYERQRSPWQTIKSSNVAAIVSLWYLAS